jgi:imidazolonepropionase-like amidohydrolase
VRSIVNFTPAEAAAIVDEAHRLGVKVSAHANGWDGIGARRSWRISTRPGSWRPIRAHG